MSSKGILQIAEVRSFLRPYFRLAIALLVTLGLLGGWAGENWPFVIAVLAVMVASIILVGRRDRIYGPNSTNAYITAVVNLLASGIIVALTGGADSPFWLLFLIGTITSALSLSGQAGNILDAANVVAAVISMVVPELVSGQMTFMVLMKIGMQIVTLIAIATMVRKVTIWVFEHGGALHESETRLELLINQIPAVLWATDTNLVFTSSLGLGLQALGLEPNQVVGMSLFEFFQTEDENFRAIVAHRQALAGSSETYEINWEDNTYQAHVEPLYDVTGKITGTIGIALDITQQKQAEEALRHSQRVESLGLLAGGVAHDFNNLLTAMLGQTSVALAKMSPDSPERPNIERAVKAAERAAELTQQLLVYSGRTPLQVQPVNMNVLIEENQHLFDVALPMTVQLQSRLAENLPYIEADSGQMQQVIMNLIINAAEAIGDSHGVVTVSTDTVLVHDRGQLSRRNEDRLRPGRYVKVAVKDDGPGIDSQTLARIFDPFFTTKPTGRGLGLAVVQGIVHSHHGNLEVVSSPGKGTSFELLFPALKIGPDKEDMIGSGTMAVSSPGAILVIDDEEVVQTAVADMLKMTDLVSIGATSGEEGIAIYEKRGAEIRLVILDIVMSGMSGFETLEKLRMIDPEVPVLLSSGYSEAEVVGRYEALGVLGFLQKPYQISRFIEMIERYLPE